MRLFTPRVVAPWQPKTLQETTQGAKNRALSAAAAEKSSSEALLGQPPCGLLGMGIESGLFEVEGKMFDICCCAIFDGTEHHIGSEPLRTSQRARPGCAPCVCARCAAYPFPHVPCRYSCAWELPDSVRRKIVHSGLDLTKAFQHICADPDIGDKGGTAHNQSPSHRILPNVTSHPPEHGVDIINSL